MNKDELLRRTLEDLGENYRVGLYEFIFKHRSDLFKQLQNIEEEIDTAYLIGTLQELKSALRKYWLFHMKVIKEFKQDENKQKDLIKARKEMMEERIQA